MAKKLTHLLNLELCGGLYIELIYSILSNEINTSLSKTAMKKYKYVLDTSLSNEVSILMDFQQANEQIIKGLYVGSKH